MKLGKSSNNCAWAALALVALAGTGLSQPVTLTGQVTESLRGKPVPKATITLRRRQPAGTLSATDVYTAVTGEDGSFRIANILDATYSVTADAQGYVLAPDGTKDELTPFTAKPGEQRTLAIQLTPAGVISGRIVDWEGDPVRGAQVVASQDLPSRNPRALAVRPITSNDRGEYRLFGLAPGAYYVRATVRDSSNMPGDNEKVRGLVPPTAFVATYYPSIRDEAASAPVHLGPGEELAHIDIRMQPAGLFTVRVRITNSPAPETNVAFDLFDRRTNTSTSAFRSNGPAEFRSVLPGSYVLVGTLRDAAGNGAPHAYARQTVEVTDHDVEMDAPPFTPAFDLPGAVHLDTAAPFSFLKMSIVAQRELPGAYWYLPAVMAADGTFAVHNVVQDAYNLSVDVPAGAYLKAIKLGNAVLPDLRVDFSGGAAPLTLLLATDGGRIRGSVENSAGESQPQALVRLYPDGAMSDRGDRAKFATTDNEGRYEIADIAPGDYRLYVWNDNVIRPWFDPDLRKTYAAQSVAVTVAPGSTQVLSLKAASAAR